ncbi:chemotaxis protein CheW [Exilibacterium tricleocarpae]|uniref:Chemotaxis protein CheW n=1 Tax=Exilibacterium tricleocarpae TaxID=2591008 RepID=A0A545U3X5_9GAMM|nr:chemotaxis protein CheW [Exilibacterium tricleocarpae]TQV84175.1 chemotaxis protein CheW [Exilibacterium tricleocarpae]
MQAVNVGATDENDQLPAEQHQGDVVEDGDQYLTFIMAHEEYGVDILCVQEIRGWEAATPIPNAPSHIKGVINLRGTIVPIVDLRQCFGLEAIEYTAVTVVIVLKVETEKGSRIMGIVVDAVSDVYSLAAAEMKSAPDLGDAVNTDYIRGLVNVDGKMVILLEIDRLLSMDDIPNLAEVSRQVLSGAADAEAQ